MGQWSKLRTGELKDVHVYLSPKWHERLSERAERNENTVSREMREILKEALQRDEQQARVQSGASL